MAISDIISTTADVAMDLTKGTEYDRLVNEEISHFSAIEVTEEMNEGGIHGQKAWTRWHEFVEQQVWHTSFYDEVATFANTINNPRILSLGCGYGGPDMRVAAKLNAPYELIAIDLNESTLKLARDHASAKNLNIQFHAADLNFVTIAPGYFDVIYAYASLHHLLNLEHVLDQIYGGLKPAGRLVIVDIIGKTQVLFWRENVEFASRLIETLPPKYRAEKQKVEWKAISHPIEVASKLVRSPSRLARRLFAPKATIPAYVEPATQVGMEGIRQEELEAEILKRFAPHNVIRVGAFIRLICTHHIIGKLLDPDVPEACEHLDRLFRLDVEQVETKALRPTEIWGSFVKLQAPVV